MTLLILSWIVVGAVIFIYWVSLGCRIILRFSSNFIYVAYVKDRLPHQLLPRPKHMITPTTHSKAAEEIRKDVAAFQELNPHFKQLQKEEEECDQLRECLAECVTYIQKVLEAYEYEREFADMSSVNDTEIYEAKAVLFKAHTLLNPTAEKE